MRLPGPRSILFAPPPLQYDMISDGGRNKRFILSYPPKGCPSLVTKKVGFRTSSPNNFSFFFEAVFFFSFSRFLYKKAFALIFLKFLYGQSPSMQIASEDGAVIFRRQAFSYYFRLDLLLLCCFH